MLFSELNIEGVRMLVWKMVESEAELSAQSLDYVYSDPYFLQIHAEQRKKEYLSIRLLLHHVFGTDERIVYNHRGRPQLVHHPDCHISISHAGPYAILSMSSVPHGIDIERESVRADRCKTYFLSPFEITLLAAHNTSATTLWSAKESAFKLLNNSSVHTLHDISLTISSSSLYAHRRSEPSVKYRVYTQKIFDEYVLSVTPSGTSTSSIKHN